MADRPQGTAKAGDNRPRLSLHVPEPKFRPGDAVDFSHIQVPEAGAQPRPDETTDPKDMLDFAQGLIRVLGEDNKAHGPWDPKLDPETLRKMLAHMAMTRAFDERMFRGQRQGKTSFYMKCTGKRRPACRHRWRLRRTTWSFPAIASRAF